MARPSAGSGGGQGSSGRRRGSSGRFMGLAGPQIERGGKEFVGTLVFGIGLLAAAGLNFVFVGAMGRLLAPPVFSTLGVLIATLLAVTAPVNALAGGTEMFAALHDRFPRGRRRLVAPAVGLVVWAATMLVPSS